MQFVVFSALCSLNVVLCFALSSACVQQMRFGKHGLCAANVCVRLRSRSCSIIALWQKRFSLCPACFWLVDSRRPCIFVKNVFKLSDMPYMKMIHLSNRKTGYTTGESGRGGARWGSGAGRGRAGRDADGSLRPGAQDTIVFRTA